MVKAFDGLQKATRSAFLFFFFVQKATVLNTVLVDISCTFAGRMLENHQREQKERYESQVAGLKLKVDHLQNESSKLQNLFQEKSNVNETIRHEVSRLSSENSVRYACSSTPEFKSSSRLCRSECDLLF